MSKEFGIVCLFVCRQSHLTAELPEVECEDGSQITPLSVTFPNGSGMCHQINTETK